MCWSEGTCGSRLLKKHDVRLIDKYQLTLVKCAMTKLHTVTKYIYVGNENYSRYSRIASIQNIL